MLAIKCAHCSGDVQYAERIGARAAIRCPRCAAADVLWLGSLEVDRCRSCSGIWVDADELKAFRTLADDVGVQEGVRSALDDMRKPAPASSTGYVSCPVCAETMSRTNHADVSGIPIDHCRRHGSWLDHDDAVRLFELMASGDEERLRARAKRNRRDDLQRGMLNAEARVGELAARVGRTERVMWFSIFYDLFDSD